MDMIRRLHRKFIWMATASVVAIIVLAVGLINGSLYVRVHHKYRPSPTSFRRTAALSHPTSRRRRKDSSNSGTGRKKHLNSPIRRDISPFSLTRTKRKRRSLTSTTSPHSTPKKPSTSLYGFSRQGNRKISSLKTGPITTIKSHRPPAVTPSSSFSTVPGTSSPSLPYSATPWRSVSSASSSSSSSSPSSPARPSSPS